MCLDLSNLAKFFHIVACGYIVGSFGMPLMTGIYEKFGNFEAVFIFCIILNFLIAVLVILSNKARKLLLNKATQIEK